MLEYLSKWYRDGIVDKRLLEKLHTDQQYYDLLLYGVEGEHYHRNEQGIHHEGIPSGKRFVGWSAAADTYAETWNTYMLPLRCGMSEDIDTELNEAIRMLKAAGLDEYLAEVQRQLTQFKQECEVK